MKKIIALSLMCFSFASQAFFMNTQCYFDRARGECTAFNHTPRTITCQLTIQGRTASGAFFNGFEFVTLYPGQYAWAYVYAQNPMYDPLVFVNGTAQCQYYR